MLEMKIAILCMSVLVFISCINHFCNTGTEWLGLIFSNIRKKTLAFFVWNKGSQFFQLIL